MKKKNFLICFGIIQFVNVIGVIYFVIQYFDIFHTMPIVSFNDLSAIQYEEKTNLSYIKDIKYGKVISKEKKVNTSTPGKKKIVIIIENNYGKKRKYQFFVNVKKIENNTSYN